MGPRGAREEISVKLVFCGTPEFAVPTLEAVIAAGHEVALVVTQPDRAAGRGMEIAGSSGEAGGGGAGDSGGAAGED